MANFNRFHLRLPFLLAALFFATSALQAQVRPVELPQTAQLPSSTRSAAIDAGDYVYISGQFGQRSDGSIPADFAAQATQALDNLQSVVTAAGLDMRNIVYVKVYLQDVNDYDQLNTVFAKCFPETPPARAVLGVSAVPQSSIEIDAVAVRDLSERRAVIPPGYKSTEPFSPGILTHDHLFVPSMQRRDQVTRTVPDNPA